MKQGTVEALYVTQYGGGKMEKVQEVEAVAAQGLKGDRYGSGTGYWTGIDECQVTLIQGEDLDEISRASGIQIRNGEHRRNIVTRGVSFEDLRGKRVRVGQAVLEYDRPRPPCTYIQSLTQPGMTRALGRRGGICVNVVESGVIRVSDAITIVP
jgi:MOSC domain-containing protein YiiM